MASGVSYSKEAPSKFPKPGDAPRRVKVIDNEEIHPPKEFILNHTIKTLDQFKTKVADGVNVKPLKGIYKRNGKMLASLEDMEDGEVLSAVKHAGRPFDKAILERNIF